MRTKSAIVAAVQIAICLAAGNAATQEIPGAVSALVPDRGYPVWLTPDADNYLPLAADQTSGLEWLWSEETDSCDERDWLLAVDDSDRGGIHVIQIADNEAGPQLTFADELTLPPPSISGIPLEPGHGYDWEAVAYHPWSGTVFLAHEGSRSEINLYAADVVPSGLLPAHSRDRSGSSSFAPGHLINVRPLRLPGWLEVFQNRFQDNLGIEGLACFRDRLFVGLESPYQFNERLLEKKSTLLAIWSIDPENPCSAENSAFLALHDTADWSTALGLTVETICGLDAVDSCRIVGIDRDNSVLFSVTFDVSGTFVGGRAFFLETPGPAPLPSDGCPPLGSLPRLLKPSLESVACVPSSDGSEFRIYAAVDPWAQGWALFGMGDWSCSSYENRLRSLLPALYRYTVPAATLLSQH